MYPHILECKKSGTTTIVDGVPATTAGTTVKMECRYRHNNGGRTVKGVDGQTVVFTGTCFTPNSDDADSISTGDIISVPNWIDTATVIQVYKGQMRTRIILM